MCLHRGVFLRPRRLAFVGRSHPDLARRFVCWCGKTAFEERWNGFGLKLCQIVDRELNRALGVDRLPPRRDATPAVALHRLLSLDYVINHLDAPLLTTDGAREVCRTSPLDATARGVSGPSPVARPPACVPPHGLCRRQPCCRP